MFKLVVLSALVAIAVAKPSGWHAEPVVAHYAAPLAVVPAAVSHTYRKDVISKPAVATYAASPVVVAEPVVEKFVAAPVAVPASVSHTYRKDVISKPAVVAHYEAPVVAKTIVSAPVLSYAAPVVAKSYVAAPVVSYAAHGVHGEELLKAW